MTTPDPMPWRDLALAMWPLWFALGALLVIAGAGPIGAALAWIRARRDR